MSTTAKTAPALVSVKVVTAARMLDVSRTFMNDLVVRGVFTVIAPNGRGRGKRAFIPADEIECYGLTRDEDAVRELRIRKHRIKPR